MSFKKMHSFVVLAYMESPYIENCICSLLEQTDNSYIYMATSTPSLYLSNLAQKYEIPLYENSNGGNIGADWNYAYGVAKTKYVTLVHQDDIYNKKYSEKCLGKAEKQVNNLITFTNYDEIINNIIANYSILLILKRMLLVQFLFSEHISNKFWKKSLLALGSPICCPSVMYNKLTLGQFGFSNNLKINLDWDAWLNMANKDGSFVYVKDRLVSHRIHEQSETSLGIVDNNRQNEDKMILERIWPKPFSSWLFFFYSFVYRIYKTGG